MTAKKEKKKTPIGFLYAVIVIMLAVFLFQMFFPTNLGKVFDKAEETAEEITVTVSRSEEAGVSYHTDSHEKIAQFGKWADEKKMRNRSLADSLSAESSTQLEYSFAIKAVDGTYTSIIIDERGFVHFGAELYKISDDTESFLKELKEQLESWEEENDERS